MAPWGPREGEDDICLLNTYVTPPSHRDGLVPPARQLARQTVGGGGEAGRSLMPSIISKQPKTKSGMIG